MSATKPLAGLNVADFSMVYAGPICARMLCDNGAAVTKIEPLGMGDSVRANSRVLPTSTQAKEAFRSTSVMPKGRHLPTN